MSIENDWLFDKMMEQYKAQEKAKNRGGKKHDKARALLRKLLGDGPKAILDIRMEAMLEGVSWQTMKRAKVSAGVKSFQIRVGGKISCWMWGLSFPVD